MHLWHFFVRSVYAMPSLVSGNWAQVVLGLFIFGFAQFLFWRKHGWPEMRKRLGESLLIGVISVGAGWFLLLIWSVAVGIYHDHFDVNGRWRAVVNEKNDLKAGLARRDTYISQLQIENDAKPKVVAREIPSAKQCWLVNDPALPPSSNKVPGAMTTTAVIIHCNYKIDAPYKILIKMDRDFIGTGTVNTPDAMMFGGSWQKQGTTYVLNQQGPALAPDQIVIVTVYGTTDQYPKAISGKIATVNDRTTP